MLIITQFSLSNVNQLCYDQKKLFKKKKTEMSSFIKHLNPLFIKKTYNMGNQGAYLHVRGCLRQSCNSQITKKALPTLLMCLGL